jgi:hypothetical protein
MKDRIFDIEQLKSIDQNCPFCPYGHLQDDGVEKGEPKMRCDTCDTGVYEYTLERMVLNQLKEKGQHSIWSGYETLIKEQRREVWLNYQDSMKGAIKLIKDSMHRADRAGEDNYEFQSKEAKNLSDVFNKFSEVLTQMDQIKKRAIQ